MMGEFRVHHVRFFDFTPSAIHCLTYEEKSSRLALSRANGAIEIWSEKDNWFQEKIVQYGTGQSVEALCWCGDRLYSAGLEGDIVEHDLMSLTALSAASSNSGAVWCLARNATEDSMVAGTEDGCVVLIQITEEGVEYARSFVKQEGRILSIAWYHPDDLIVTGGIDNIRIWSVKTGQAVQRLTMSRAGINTETIVWSLAVTDDFTIISGDSQGKTSFWNGKQGTLYTSFQCHKADVLAVCVNRAGNSVFSAGIDPTLTQFEYISASPDSDLKMWVKSCVRTQHTHDIRALALTQDMVISGGVDCRLMLNQVVQKKNRGKGQKAPIKLWQRISPIPQDPLVYTARAAGMIMLRYQDYLEVWQLGATSKTHTKSEEILQLDRNPVKLVQLKSRLGEPIVCAAISDTAEWLAYGDTASLRIFRLSMEEVGDLVTPQVKITKIHKLPAALVAPHRLMFSPSEDRLVVTGGATLQLLELSDSLPSLLWSTTMATDKASSNNDGIHLLCVSPSGDLAAVANHHSEVRIFNLEKHKLVSNLPTYSIQPTAMAFHPSLPKLVVAYADQKIKEYDYSECAYTAWSNTLESKWHPVWLQRSSKITQIMYNPHKPLQIFVINEYLLTIIDQTQDLPRHNDKLYQRSRWLKEEPSSKPAVKHAFHICDKFRYLMHADILDDDFVVVVERPVQALMDKLPSALKEKKFGT